MALHNSMRLFNGYKDGSIEIRTGMISRQLQQLFLQRHNNIQPVVIVYPLDSEHHDMMPLAVMISISGYCSFILRYLRTVLRSSPMLRLIWLKLNPFSKRW